MKKDLLKSEWVPKDRKYATSWKITKVFTHEDGEQIFRIEKRHHGRNSPSLVTLKQLKRGFSPLTEDYYKWPSQKPQVSK